MTIDPHRVLEQAGAIIGERGRDYGDIEDNFDRIAQLANIVLGANYTALDISLIMVCVKLARIKESSTKGDNYIDGINYLAFASELAGAE